MAILQVGAPLSVGSWRGARGQTDPEIIRQLVIRPAGFGAAVIDVQPRQMDASVGLWGEATVPGEDGLNLENAFSISQFEDNSLGTFTMGGHNPEDHEIIDDPTGSGRGKVLHLSFINRTDPLRSQDVEVRAVHNFADYAVGPGATVYSYQKLYIEPNSYTGNRKLWRYYCRAGGNASDITLWHSTTLRVEGPMTYGGLYYYNTANNGSGIGSGWASGVIQFSRWYELEVQMTMDSALSAGDGIFRVWLDRNLIFEKTDFGFINSAGPFLDSIHVGNQHSGGRLEYGPVDDHRYWDDLILSTERIAP